MDCWCGSGKPYAACHRDRGNAQALPVEAIAAQVRRYFRRKECLHPDAPKGCGKAIKAHTVSRSSLLETIIDSSNKVFTFLDTFAETTTEPQPIGWREASTFAGFCGSHDGPLFAPIEQRPFAATSEQCFLLAYRAICHELYQKRSASNARPDFHALIDRGLPPYQQIQVQRALHAQTRGVLKGFADAIDVKGGMDAVLQKKTYEQWTHTIFRFSGDVSIVTAGVPTPNLDLRGEQIQILHDLNERIQPMPVGMIVTETGFAVVISGRRSDPAPMTFAAQLRALPSEHVPHVIAQIMFAYIENTFFSRAWWDSRREYIRDHVRQIAQQPNPYYYPPNYLTQHVVPWRLESIAVIG